jgi:hypothetical protein
MDQPLGHDPQAPTALAAPERNHFFYGKLLDVPHLDLEQDYFNAKRWLLNRLLDGAGVVTGLAVAPAVNGTRLAIQPGVAVDGWGREIVVPALSVPFDPRTLIGDDGKTTGTVTGAGSVTIGICYKDCGISPEPVMIANCNPAGDCAPGITREQYALIVQAGTALPSPSKCTFTDLFKPPANSNDIPDIHPKLAGRIAQPYTDPTGKGCVLLAQVNLPASGAITAAMVDNTVRPVVVSTGLLLELIFCLAQRVQQLAGPSPTPTPTPTPAPTPTPTPTPTPKV